MTKPDLGKLDKIVADARRAAEQRQLSYRERALKMYPWIRGVGVPASSTRTNLRELTVHHRDPDNHENNPADGRNWAAAMP